VLVDLIRPQRELADVVVRCHPPTAAWDPIKQMSVWTFIDWRPIIPHPDLTYLMNHRNGKPAGIRPELGATVDGRWSFLKSMAM
jgi:hypothetical protein